MKFLIKIKKGINKMQFNKGALVIILIVGLVSYGIYLITSGYTPPFPPLFKGDWI